MKSANKSLAYLLIFVPVLMGLVFVFLPASSIGEDDADLSRGLLPASPDRIEPERLVFLLQYLGTDYSAAVKDGEVISDFEYREMLDFSRIVIEQYQQLLPVPDRDPVLGKLQLLRSLIQDKADPEKVHALTSELIPQLSQQFNIVVYPSLAPDLAQGRRIYQANCASCHGEMGAGNGPAAADLDPEPRSFRDSRMNAIPPYQMYNAVTFGVTGTAMPSHSESLTEQERWDVAFYLMTLREDFEPARQADFREVPLQELATRSNEQLLSKLATGTDLQQLHHLDYLRKNPPQVELKNLTGLARRKLQQSFQNYQDGNMVQAVNLSLAAYLEGIEPVEAILIHRDRDLMRRIEERFSSYRASLNADSSPDEVSSTFQELDRAISEGEEALSPGEASWGFSLIQSLVIILREGIEAALLLGLMLTYLGAGGFSWLKQWVTGGALAGIAAGFLTWVLASYLLSISPLQQEAMEGVTSLLAAAVLFTVSLWIIHHADIRQWKSYIQSRAEQALGRGSGWVLATAAFLAVYREAFETVLFYQALWHTAQDAHTGIIAGFLAGSALLGLMIS